LLGLRRLLDLILDGILGALKWLVLPVSLLLFLQWPLRDWIQAYSREANDGGQWIFALYVAASLTAASRAGTHLAVDSFARRYSRRVRRVLARVCDVCVLAPWAIFVAVSAAPAVRSSLGQWEHFPDTGNPGYFIVKLALWLMVGLLLVLSIVVELLGREPGCRN
jgi:TRAP-type mannitol/chloroaromatic compound transport system permease small subunit